MIGAFSSQTEIWGQSLELETEAQVHVLAPSGTGKSTLIGILYGSRKDFDGEVKFNGEDIKDWSDQRANNISIVFQDLELLSDLSALENVQLKNQLTAHLSDAQINDMAIALGLENLLNKRVGLLSRGERQRVAIIRALCMPFKWLLLDEPFSALDEVNTQKAVQLITQEVKKNNAGLVVANLSEDNHFNYTQKIRLA